MASKWCSRCQKIVTTNTTPKFCAWCGKDLRLENILPQFNTWTEREKLVKELLQAQKVVTHDTQLSLFRRLI